MNKNKLWNRIVRFLIIAVFTAGITSFAYVLLHIQEESKLTLLLDYWESLKPLPKVILSAKVIQTLVLTLMSFGLSCVICSKRIIRIIAGFATFAAMMILPFFHLDLPEMTIICILIITCFNIIDCISPPMEKKANVTTSFILFCLIPAFFLMVIPQTNKPLQWNLAKSIWKRSVQACMDMRDFAQETFLEIKFGIGILPNEYRMKFTGYSGEGELNGEINDNNREMLVAFGRRPNGNLYLNGAVSDTYTGSSWEKNINYKNAPWVKEIEANELLKGKYADGSDAVLTEYTLDYAEMMRALTLTGKEKPVIRDSANNFTITLTHSHLKTKTLFYPLKTFRVENHNRMDYRNEGPNLVFDKAPKNSSDGYKLSYLDVDYESELLTDMMLHQVDYGYGEIIKDDSGSYHDQMAEIYQNTTGVTLAEGMAGVSKGVFAIGTNERLFREALAILPKRSEWIRENYVALPDTLPERVKELANEITDGCTTSYEKMEAIREYLASEEYTYTKRPRQVEGTDFIDTFLFDTKEGYCTYFATALAVLGRCVGVPTRYVEGFYCDYSNVTEDNDYAISGSDGHAWCEYYVEGIGWILLEGVPGAGFARAYRHVDQSTSVNQEPLKVVELDPIEFTPLTEEEVVRRQVQSTLELAKPYIILGVLVLVIVVIFLIWQVKLARIRKWYRKANNSEKILYLFDKMKGTMRHLQKDVTVSSNFTMTEWMARMCSLTSDPLSYKEGKDICLTARYSDSPIDSNQVLLFERLLTELGNAKERLQKEKREKEKKEIRDRRELLRKVKRDKKKQRHLKRIEKRDKKREEKRTKKLVK